MVYSGFYLKISKVSQPKQRIFVIFNTAYGGLILIVTSNLLISVNEGKKIIFGGVHLAYKEFKFWIVTSSIFFIFLRKDEKREPLKMFF